MNAKELNPSALKTEIDGSRPWRLNIILPTMATIIAPLACQHFK